MGIWQYWEKALFKGYLVTFDRFIKCQVVNININIFVDSCVKVSVLKMRIEAPYCCHR